MRQVLNVAEKPSIAKHLMTALSENGTRTLKSESKYNPIYAFDGTFQGDKAEIIITSVTGHIREIEFPEQYKKWDTFDPLVLLKEAHVVVRDSEDKRSVIKNLENLARKITDLFLWLDCDREGEAIAYEVIDICSRTNRNMRIFRAKFSSVAKQDLRRAFLNPSQPNPNLNQAVLLRQEVDLRSGACFTRFQTLILRKFYPKIFEKSKVVSYGPCQFPTLYFVVERYLDHVAFKNMKFWTLNLVLEKSGIVFDLIWNRNRLFDQFTVYLIYEIEMDRPEAKVIKLIKRDQKKLKPYPLTTVELQKLAVSKLRMSSDKAMKVAENLYIKGFISYPRTETNVFPNSFDFKKVIGALSSNPEFHTFVENMVNNNKFERPRAGQKDDKAHPPIHPIKDFNGDQNSDEYKLFDLVARHYLASCSEDAQTEVTDVVVKINEEFFHTSGVRIVEKNFLEIYEKYYILKEKKLPQIEQGEIIPIKEFMTKEGTTTPPKLLTEQELIAMMDKFGIGTDATLHEHIKTIQERNYAVKVGTVFKPTQLGLAMLGAYIKIGLSLANPKNRADTEKNMGLVVDGLKTRQQLTQEILTDLEAAYQRLTHNTQDFLKNFKEIFEHFFHLSNVELETAENVNLANPQPLRFRQNNPPPQNNAPQNQPPKNHEGQINLDCCEFDDFLLRVRLSKQKKYFVGCSNYPKCKNIFFFTLKMTRVTQSNEECAVCRAKLVEIEKNADEEDVTLYCPMRECQQSIFKILQRSNVDHGVYQSFNPQIYGSEEIVEEQNSRNTFFSRNRFVDEEQLQIAGLENNVPYPSSSRGFQPHRSRNQLDEESMRHSNSRNQTIYGNSRGQNASSSMNPRQQRNFACFNCGEEGHFVRDCPRQQRQKYTRARSPPNGRRGFGNK